MNMKELEGLVLAQGREMGAIKAEANNATIAMAIVQGRVADLEAKIQALINVNQDQDHTIQQYLNRLCDLEANHCAMVVVNSDQGDGLAAMSVLVENLSAKVEGRNKSAAVKRNMTDADAIRVLQGDLIGLGHKETAEVIGLTYAQIYSCRLGFTFKHVIRDLEKSGWASPWAKG